jgi:hypothetical protein
VQLITHVQNISKIILFQTSKNLLPMNQRGSRQTARNPPAAECLQVQTPVIYRLELAPIDTYSSCMCRRLRAMQSDIKASKQQSFKASQQF